MDLAQVTERSRGFIQAAQNNRRTPRESHQRLTPEHFTKSLWTHDQGLASNLIVACGCNPAAPLPKR